jgi:hypothetical protein
MEHFCAGEYGNASVSFENALCSAPRSSLPYIFVAMAHVSIAKVFFFSFQLKMD